MTYRIAANDAKERRQTPSTGKIKGNINLKDTSGVLCTDLPTRPGAGCSLPSVALVLHCPAPPSYSLYSSPLHRGGPCAAKKLLESFNKSTGPVVVTQFKSSLWGYPGALGLQKLMEFQQKVQPLLQNGNILVNKLLFHFTFAIISEC